MKKVGNIIVAVIVGLCWVYFFYKFSETGTFAKVLFLIILVPYTAKVVYSFLLEHSQNKNMSNGDELADNFTPFSASNTSSATVENICYCTACGAKNQQGTRFCANCGNPI